MTDPQYVEMPGGYPVFQGVPSSPPSNKSDLLEKIKPELVAEAIRQRLLGRELINGSWIDIPALKSRRLSETGAFEISNLILGTSSLNVSISKWDSQKINKRLRGITKSLMINLLSNWQEYGIKDASQYYFIKEIVFTNCMGVFNQADGASIQELLKGTVSENRYVATEQKRPSRIKRALGMVD